MYNMIAGQPQDTKEQAGNVLAPWHPEKDMAFTRQPVYIVSYDRGKDAMTSEIIKPKRGRPPKNHDAGADVKKNADPQWHGDVYRKRLYDFGYQQYPEKSWCAEGLFLLLL
ncbi:hypothetical protein [Morganella morganii]|uniref:hypothetical protein n=1 Tax=Morganella morganii TaxID=582 RepID=UPI003F8787B7